MRSHGAGVAVAALILTRNEGWSVVDTCSIAFPARGMVGELLRQLHLANLLASDSSGLAESGSSSPVGELARSLSARR